ncbi:MAG: AAA family ATPase [Prosthecobacter sp.]|uniref:AAA family ATPase n=1 Tax=Prosthecobacter sp. TaxID=1965333 RepID=UPI002636C63A|nr:ATP-binding protein [Prosthecobacter sp.]MCF7789918.1 AAA family ATPase [Prosthecobacter sp.]
MIITRVKLRNWKNFKNVDVNLRGRVFVVGANASGKSNFLDVFRFLRDIAKSKGGGLQQAVGTRGGLTRVRCLAARKNPLVEVEVEMGDLGDTEPKFRYAIGIRQENKGKRRIMLSYERVWKEGEQIVNRPEADSDDTIDDERLTMTYLENATTNASFREVAELFGSVSYLHLVPQLLRSVKSAEIEQSGEDFYGRNFLVRVSRTPERIRKARLKRIMTALGNALPQFDGLKDDKDSAGVPHLLLRLKHWRPDAGWQNEEQFSDGTIRLLGLFWSMLEGDSILLFEEPELSLNDRIVEMLPGLLWKLQVSKGRQAILTTHSVSLLSDPGIAPEDVLLLENAAEGTEIKQLSSIPEAVAMIRTGMSVGAAVLPRTAPQTVSDLTL